MSIKVVIHIILLSLLAACAAPNPPSPPQAHQGVLNLRQWNFAEQPKVALCGEWAFYFDEYLSTKQLSARADKSYIIIKKQADGWKGQPWAGAYLGSFGYATFYLQIILPKEKSGSLALKIPPPKTSYQAYVNGQLLGKVGKAGINHTSSIPAYAPILVPLNNLESDTLQLVMHVANFHHRKGGIAEAPTLGLKTKLESDTNYKIWRDIFLMGTFFMMGINHLFLFFLYRKGVSSLYFALICFITLGRSLVLGEMLIQHLIPAISWEWMLRIEYLGFFGNVLFAALFARALFPQQFSRWVTQLLVGFNALCLGLIFVTPARIHSFIFPFAYIIIPFILVVLIIVTIAMVRQKAKGGGIYLAGNFTVILTIINDVLYHSGIIHTTDLIFLGVFAYFFSQSFLIAQRFSLAFYQVADSSKKLKMLNETLELRVSSRTHELKQQKDAIDDKNQKLEIQAKRINDSIKVAQNIQQAILPDEQQLKQYFSDYFLMYRPKDMVSGDFYWIHQVQEQLVVVAADCTGHGVPGAMMTMIGKMSLDKIVKDQQITSPETIIHHLHQEIHSILAKDRAYDYHGMDLAIFTLQPHTSTQYRLTFAGAKISLYYITFPYREFQSLAGSRKPIEGEAYERSSFQNQEVILPKQAMIYVGSDGLADQNNHRRRRFGTKLLYELLKENAHLSAAKQKEVLEEALELHMLKSEQRDDILWLGLRL
ncbi:hypothetical protein BKI52_10350 [marine bacterium AO1-C]|nr:hypothetical protein BKI52_10350 [marine bacterium AO1-C]